MTSTGYGDMYPSKLIVQIVNVCQMSVAMAYNIGFFGIGVTHFKDDDDDNNNNKSKNSIRFIYSIYIFESLYSNLYILILLL